MLRISPRRTCQPERGFSIIILHGFNQRGKVMMTKYRGSFVGAWLMCFTLSIGLIAGCSTMRPGFVSPTVNITSFKPLPSEGIAPKFEMSLRVVNPNATQLSLRGMSYTLALNNFAVVDGAANALPVVPAYGEAEFKVVATVGVFEGIRFVSDLLQHSKGQVAYTLKAKLDVGAMLPAINIEKTGSYAQ
jgi:Late embryogenesis abundant protein